MTSSSTITLVSAVLTVQPTPFPWSARQAQMLVQCQNGRLRKSCNRGTDRGISGVTKASSLEALQVRCAHLQIRCAHPLGGRNFSSSLEGAESVGRASRPSLLFHALRGETPMQGATGRSAAQARTRLRQGFVGQAAYATLGSQLPTLAQEA